MNKAMDAATQPTAPMMEPRITPTPKPTSRNIKDAGFASDAGHPGLQHRVQIRKVLLAAGQKFTQAASGQTALGKTGPESDGAKTKVLFAAVDKIIKNS